MAKKTFILDTNVLIHDPDAINKFPASELIIPLTVIEELDQFKRNTDEVGKSARNAIRHLDALRLKFTTDLKKGVQLENKSTLRIEVDMKQDVAPHVDLNNNDNKIILTGCLLKDQGKRVVFVSKDLAARIKALAFGLDAEDYENLKVSYDKIYTGLTKIQTDKKNIDILLKDGFLPKKSVSDDILDKIAQDYPKIFPNQYFYFESPENSHALCKYIPQKDGWRLIKPLTYNLWGVEARNLEQRCALDLLLDDSIKLVSLMGSAGTGKTLLALAAGLRKVFEENVYSKILVSRPIIPLGKDIGFLPGTKEEKLSHWMQPIYDNLEFLSLSSEGGENEAMQWLLGSKKIEMEAVTYIRGRSLPKMFMIIDEAQNLTPHEIKTVISRAGEGTKVVLTGDPTQIDHPYLDKDSNGLSFAVGKLKPYELFGHIRLEKTERSALAALAAEVM